MGETYGGSRVPHGGIDRDETQVNVGSRTSRPTMRDVADRAGVGVVTVSRVVNGERNVGDATATRVHAAIDELGYQRDEIARSLRPGQNSRTVGLVLGDLTNPFYPAIAKGVASQLKTAGYAVLLSSADEDADAERQGVDELLGRRVAGLVMVPGQSDHSFLTRANRHARVPLVFIDRPARGADGDVVIFDNERGGRMAVEHLIAHGHRRIAIVVAPSHYTTGLRRRGYNRALQRAGIPLDERLVVKLRSGSVEDAAEATGSLLDREDAPTAIFSTTNFLTEGVLQAMRDRGVQKALVGFDDFRLANMLPSPVTVVTGDAEELGRSGAATLLSRISGEPSPFKRIVIPVRLIERGSGEIPADVLDLVPDVVTVDGGSRDTSARPA
ncbi:LacI family DNA-binding transcriptional regulator [Humibacter antri]